MSNYKALAVHPVFGEPMLADFLDDYFGPHEYAVKFADGGIYEIKETDQSFRQYMEHCDKNDATPGWLAKFQAGSREEFQPAGEELPKHFDCQKRCAPSDPLLATREETHGAYKDTARIAQKLKQVVLDNGIDLSDVQAESLDLICTKISRILSGNPNEPDHWRDIAGYAGLVVEALTNE